MKSIELSEEELLTKKEREVIQKCLQIGFNKGKIPYLAGDALCKKLDKYLVENAKPIPTEPRWSEEEIRYALDKHNWAFGAKDLFISDLKTPKPRLRDRTFKEKLIWLSEQENCEDYYFKSDFERHNPHMALVESSKYYKTTLESDDWLQIPQIEIESEK